MSYSDYGLDEKKKSSDIGRLQDGWLCLWGSGNELIGHRVSDGFSLCFSNIAICRSCTDSATKVENNNRWHIGYCFKCMKKDQIIFCSDEQDLNKGMTICKECIDWAKETFQNQDKRTPKTGIMETIEILLKCVVVGNTVKLPNVELDKANEYAPVKKALEKIGGRWNTKAQGFIYDSDPTELLAAIQRGENVDLNKDFQFFSTPAPLANYMVSNAYDCLLEKNPRAKILEPSAGDGALVKSLVKLLNRQRVDCFELMEQNRIKLQSVAGADILGNDFLEAVDNDTTLIGQYDLVIANPPFTKNQDIDHIRAMYKCIKPGGWLVTLSSMSWTFGEQKKQMEFKEWLKSLAADLEEITPGQFKDSGTQVGAMLITLQKPIDDNQINNTIKKEVIPETKLEEEPVTVEEEEYPEPDEILQQIADGLKEANNSISQMRNYLNPEKEMDFFKQISELMGQSEVTLTLKAKGDKITVMVLHKTGSYAANTIPPLIITGTPDELDEGFFGEVDSPLRKITGLVSNAQSVDNSLAEKSIVKTDTTDKPSRKKGGKKADSESGVDSESLSDKVEGPVEQVESEEEKQKREEQERVEKEQEEERLRLETEKQLAAERKEKFDVLVKEAHELSEAEDFRTAAFKLKAAKEFTDVPEELTTMIKNILTKPAEKEMEEMG